MMLRAENNSLFIIFAVNKVNDCMLSKIYVMFSLLSAALLINPASGIGQEFPENAQAGSYPKVGLVLGGGGARGFAHIGVIRVIEELGIPIDYIAGTSMGSLVGALYAAGYSIQDLETITKEINWDEVFSDTPPRRTRSFVNKRMSAKYLFGLGFTKHGFSIPTGLTKGQKISTLFSFLTLPVSDIQEFDSLPIPFRAVAADIVTGDEVVLDRGSLAEAMRASMSVPGVFTPVESGEHLLVDGGIVNNVPADVVKSMGADILIVVDVSSGLAEKKGLNNPISILTQMVGIQMLKKTQTQYKLADVLIRPDLQKYTSSDFNSGAQIADLGEQAARAQYDEFKALAEKIRQTRALGRSIPPSALKASQNIYIEQVNLEGASGKYADSALKKFLEKHQGAMLDPKFMADTVSTIFNTGRYESVKFYLSPGEKEGKILNLRLEEKTSNPNLLRFGMSYDSRFADDEPDKMAFLTNMTINELTGKESIWSTDLQFVNVRKLQTQYFQPILPGLFLLPEIYTTSDYQVLYENKDSIGRYDIDRDGFTVSLGGMHARVGLFSVGYNLETVNSKLKANTPVEKENEAILEHDDLITSVSVNTGIDTQDDFPFPHSGSMTEIHYKWASEKLGGDKDFQRLSFHWRRYFALSKKHTLGFRLEAGSDLKTDMPEYEHFTLGGRDSFAGYKIEEIRGAQLGIAAFEYRYELLKLPSPIGGGLFLTLLGNVGNAWKSYDELKEDADLRYGGSLGAGVDTLLGRVTADYGVGDGGRNLFYLTIGNRF